MDKNISKKVKTLVAENELEEALDLMISAEEKSGQDRYHTLLLLRGRLSMLKEQELAGTLDFEEVMQQKAKIAHSLLRMTEGKTPEVKLPPIEPAQQVKPASSSIVSKYLLTGALIAAVAVAVFFILKPWDKNAEPQPREQITQKDETPEKEESKPRESNDQVRLLDFPMLGQPFNFSDIRYTFREARLEKYSDGNASEPAMLKLTISMELICRSNMGICYREEIRILADGKPVAPAERENLAGWLEHNSSAVDVQTFIFAAGAKEYQLKLEKNKSTWRRTFKILR